MRSHARTSSFNVLLTRDDFTNGDSVPSDGYESASSSDELDLNEQDIPVRAGFAVAHDGRNADFHDLFPDIPEGDYLIEDYACALQREILVQGRLYISENHISFRANDFGWIINLSIPIIEITGLEKGMTSSVTPNAIQITTSKAKHTFASFHDRDAPYDVITNIWRLAWPGGAPKPTDSPNGSTHTSASFTISVSDGSEKESSVVGTNKVTHCACSEIGSHLAELVLETVLPGTPDRIFNLMFASGFIKDFMKADQKLADVRISDWEPIDETSKLIQRNMSYIKPLDGDLGPKQTKCEIHDETVYCDFDDYVVMITSTRTPDIPSGGVFVVKTQTCFMWASSIATRVIVTTQVEWTGRSFVKGVIQKWAIEGQRVYYSDLDKAMRMYIQRHQAEFIPEGIDPATVAPVEPITSFAEIIGDVDVPLSAQEATKARNRSGLQWAYDTLGGAYHVAERSIKGALGLVKETWEQPSPPAAPVATSVLEVSGKENFVAGATKATSCACSTNGGHFSEQVLVTVLPSTPNRIFILMFASGFIRDFMKDQKFTDVHVSDWTPISQTSELLRRNMSYIKPLNGNVGPRQTKCEIYDEAVHCNFEDYIVMVTSTKTPDVPSGGVFAVKTRTCLMWASSTTTRLIVTTEVEWTGRSFIKSLIEKSAIEGQKVYYSDLDKAMRMYIRDHQFISGGFDPAEVAPDQRNFRRLLGLASPVSVHPQSTQPSLPGPRESPRVHDAVVVASEPSLDPPTTTSPDDLTDLITRDGHDPVASGGFADIYRGMLQKNRETVKVAIKSIKTYSVEDGSFSKKKKRIRREIKVWLNLKHANVLPLLGTTMGFGRFPAMVCPWAENGTLTTYLEDRYNSLSLVELLSLLNGVASGIHYLHSCSTVHGDLSGSNVLVRGNGRACIADFGLSMLLTELGASTFATSFHARGTLRWTAPELLDLTIPDDDDEESARVGPTRESDVYSFGSVMLQILSGKVPYHYYRREAQVIHAVSKGMTPERPSSTLVTDDRWTFIQQCWTTLDITQSRPSGEDLVEFTRAELAAAGGS